MKRLLARSPSRSVLLPFLTIAAIILAVLAFAAGPLGAIVPALDQLNHLAGLLFLTALAVLGGLWLIWRQRWAQGAVGLVCAGFATLVFGSSTVPDRLASVWPPAPVAADAPRLRVVSLNMWVTAPTHEAAIAYLAAADADFVVLQEAAGLWGPEFAPLRAAYPYVIPSISAPYAYMAILSKHRPVRINALAGRHYGLTAEGGRPRHIRWADAEFDVGGVRAHVVAFHAHRGRMRDQRDQLDALAAGLSDAPNPAALIVAGDFNMTPSTHSLRQFGARADLSRLTRATATFPAPDAGYPVPFAVVGIDHVFAGSGWRRLSAGRGPNVGSDHYPVEALIGARR